LVHHRQTRVEPAFGWSTLGRPVWSWSWLVHTGQARVELVLAGPHWAGPCGTGIPESGVTNGYRPLPVLWLL